MKNYSLTMIAFASITFASIVLMLTSIFSSHEHDKTRLPDIVLDIQCTADDHLLHFVDDARLYLSDEDFEYVAESLKELPMPMLCYIESMNSAGTLGYVSRDASNVVTKIRFDIKVLNNDRAYRITLYHEMMHAIFDTEHVDEQDKIMSAEMSLALLQCNDSTFTTKIKEMFDAVSR